MDLSDIMSQQGIPGPEGPDRLQIQYGLLLGSGFLFLLGGAMVVAPTLSRVGKEVLRGVASKSFMVYSETRSKYRWRLRLKTPNFARPILDWVFKLSTTASVDSPRNVAESLKVISATLTREDMSVDVRSLVEECLEKGLGDTGKVALHMDKLVPSTANTDFKEPKEWSLEVLYRGHADPSKRIPAEEFGVKYTAKAQAFMLFPPYKATEKIKRGFTSNKVLHARTFHEKNLTPLAKKYAGLYANFYKDVVDPQIHKFHVDHPEMHVLVSEKGKAPTTIIVSRKK